MQQCTVGSNPTLSANIIFGYRIHHAGEIPKWWRGSPAKGVGLERVARVQIPLSPPDVKCPRCVKIKHLGHFSYVLNWKKFPISEEFFRILKYFSSQSHTRAHECTRKSAKTLHTIRCIMTLTHSIKSSVNASISWHSHCGFRMNQYPLSFFLRFSLFLIE